MITITCPVEGCKWGATRRTKAGCEAAWTLHRTVSHSGGTPIVAQDAR